MEHLDEEQVAQYVEAMHLGRTEELPREILDHVEDCLDCKREIMELAALTVGAGPALGAPPYLDDRAAEERNPRGNCSAFILRAVAICVILLVAAVIFFLFIR